MALKLYYHPFSRASNVVWMLEEAGADYELTFVDLMAGAHKKPDILALNPMGKLPILDDGGQIVTESAAIALYLADHYAPGTLAPALDTPERGTYYRWILFSPSVIEPGAVAHSSDARFSASRVGWGTYESMLDTIEHAIGDRTFLLGDEFSMADVVFGGTVAFMLQFDMLEKRPAFEAYVARLLQRPARQRADAVNAAMIKAHRLDKK